MKKYAENACAKPLRLMKKYAENACAKPLRLMEKYAENVCAQPLRLMKKYAENVCALQNKNWTDWVSGKEFENETEIKIRNKNERQQIPEERKLNKMKNVTRPDKDKIRKVNVPRVQVKRRPSATGLLLRTHSAGPVSQTCLRLLRRELATRLRNPR